MTRNTTALAHTILEIYDLGDHRVVSLGHWNYPHLLIQNYFKNITVEPWSVMIHEEVVESRFFGLWERVRYRKPLFGRSYACEADARVAFIAICTDYDAWRMEEIL